MSSFFDSDAAAQEAIERVNAQVEAAQEMAARAQEFAAQAEELRGETTSAGGYVHVRVNTAGLLMDLELSERAMSLRAEQLAALIVRTVHEGHALAGESAVALAQESFGEDSSIAQQMASEVEARVITVDDDDGETDPLRRTPKGPSIGFGGKDG